MDKRYQVFVSSTYSDLQDERHEVMQALLELDCIPAGMELFPAANEDQWSLIKKVIDDCDYYIVIVAGRYGSVGKDGLSYTEMEYRYALDTGKPVIGFIHKDPGELPANRCESAENGKARLTSFRDLVKQKVCRFWATPADLGSQVSRSLVKLIKSHPGIGWVRGNLVPDESTVEEILSLRRRVEEQRAEIEATRFSGPDGSSNLAQGEDKFELRFAFQCSFNNFDIEPMKYEEHVSVPWNTIFSSLSPLMINEATERQLIEALNTLVREASFSILQADTKFSGKKFLASPLTRMIFRQLKIQLRALGLIAKSVKARSVKDTATYWTLTPYGDNSMTRLRAIRRSAPDGAVTPQ